MPLVVPAWTWSESTPGWFASVVNSVWLRAQDPPLYSPSVKASGPSPALSAPAESGTEPMKSSKKSSRLVGWKASVEVVVTVLVVVEVEVVVEEEVEVLVLVLLDVVVVVEEEVDVEEVVA